MEHPGTHESHPASTGLRRLALSATVHCLTGCAIGEVLGMVGHGDRHRARLGRPGDDRSGGCPGVRLRLCADDAAPARRRQISISPPDAMDAGLDAPRFRGSLAFALFVASAVAFPVNVWLIRRGRSHAVVHGHQVGPSRSPRQGQRSLRGT
jgi:hypothetical protein